MGTTNAETPPLYLGVELETDHYPARGRYFAVNITHRNTVEVRIFKGTLVLSTLLASLELVDFLVKFVKDRTIQELQRSTWETLVASIGTEYVNLNAYLVNKHLKGG